MNQVIHYQADPQPNYGAGSPGYGGGFVPPNPEIESAIDLRDTWNRIMRHRWLVLACFALVVGSVAVFTSMATPIYQASTTVRIDEKSAALKDLDFLSGRSGGSQISTEMEVLKSRALAESIVDSVRLQMSLEFPNRTSRDELLTNIVTDREAPAATYELARERGGSFLVTDVGTKRTIGRAVPGKPLTLSGASVVLTPAAAQHDDIRIVVVPFRRAVDRLLGSLVVDRPSRDANIVAIRYRSPDPLLTRDVPNALANQFIARRTVVQKTEARSTSQFLRRQLDTLSQQLAAAENEMQSFREGQQVVNLEAEGTSRVTQLAQMQAQRYELESERTSLTRLMNEVKAAAAKAQPADPSPYRRILAFPSLLQNAASSQYLTALIRFEDERAELLSRRTVRDPDVVAINARIADIEGQIWQFASTYLDGLNSKAASQDAVLAGFSKELERIPAKEVDFTRLQRRPKVLEGIFTTLQERLKEAEISQAVEDPSVRVVDYAILPLSPVEPNMRMNLMLAAVVGLALGLAAAFARDRMDQTIHTREQMQSLTGLPVLGLIPRIRNGSVARKRLFRRGAPPVNEPALPRVTPSTGTALVRLESRMIAGIDPRNPVSEAFRGMRTNITFARADRPARSLLFTSPMPGDGKTTSAANLAITLAQQGLRVILVDADMRRGVLNSTFGVHREPGLSMAVLRPDTLAKSIHHLLISEGVAMDFMATGPLPPNPAELLGSRSMRDLLAKLESMYDMVIFDTPPLNLVTDAAILGTLVDGVLVVGRASVTHQAGIIFAVEQLRNVNANVLGTVLNDVDFERDLRYYSSGYGYYRYAYDEPAT